MYKETLRGIAGIGLFPVVSLLLFVMVFVLGWLFYAGIDPDEASAGPTTSSEQPRSRD